MKVRSGFVSNSSSSSFIVSCPVSVYREHRDGIVNETMDTARYGKPVPVEVFDVLIAIGDEDGIFYFDNGYDSSGGSNWVKSDLERVVDMLSSELMDILGENITLSEAEALLNAAHTAMYNYFYRLNLPGVQTVHEDY